MNEETLLQSKEESKKETKSKLKKSKTKKRILNWSIGILIVAFLIFVNIYFQNFYVELYYITKSIMDEKSFMTYLQVFLLMILLQMLFVPGISFFIIFVSYVCKDYWYSISLVVPSSYATAALSFVITKYTVRNWVHRKLAKNIYFRMFYDKSKQKPWSTSFILRFIMIPVTYKNYLISLMDINFVQFMVPSLLFYFPYFSVYVSIGLLISSINDIINNKSPIFDLKSKIILATVHGSLAVFSLFFFIYLICMTCKLKKKYKEEERKKKEDLNAKENKSQELIL